MIPSNELCTLFMTCYFNTGGTSVIWKYLKENRRKLVVNCLEQLGKKLLTKVKIHTEFSKLWLIILLYVFRLNCCHAEFKLKCQWIRQIWTNERISVYEKQQKGTSLRQYYGKFEVFTRIRHNFRIALTKFERWAEKS